MRNELSSENKVRAAVSAVVGAIIWVCLAIGYIGRWGRAYEMTFISNCLTGTLLLFSAVKLCVTGKAMPHVLYLDCYVLLTVVLSICAIFAPDTTHGFPSNFLHIFDPILAAAFYFAFCDGRGCRTGYAFTALIMPVLYFLFMIVYGRVTGGYIYIYFDPNGMSAAKLAMYGAVASALIVFVSVGSLKLNKLLFAKREVRSKRTAERSFALADDRHKNNI